MRLTRRGEILIAIGAFLTSFTATTATLAGVAAVVFF